MKEIIKIIAAGTIGWLVVYLLFALFQWQFDVTKWHWVVTTAVVMLSLCFHIIISFCYFLFRVATLDEEEGF